METLEQFAEQHKVKTKKGVCGVTVIPGKNGDIFDGFLNGLGVCIMHATAKKWGNARRAMEAAGFTIRQDGDTEGTAVFNPADKTQAKLALKLAGIHTRRQSVAASPAQIAQRAAFAQRARLKASGHDQEGALEPVLAP